MLISLSGLPGSGKSTIARQVALRLGAVWLRVDSMEQAIRASALAPPSVEDAGYRAAIAVAEDNLRLGLTVVGDCVNPWMLTRDAWRNAGWRAGAHVLEVEIVCGDIGEHRRRIEARQADIPGLIAPGWRSVENRGLPALGPSSSRYPDMGSIRRGVRRRTARGHVTHSGRRGPPIRSRRPPGRPLDQTSRHISMSST